MKKFFAMLSCAIFLQMPLVAFATGLQLAACQQDDTLSTLYKLA